MWVTLQTAIETGFHSSLCMPKYTDKDKEMDFAALQYVHSHMQTLVWLPILSVFTCVLPWSFKGYYVVLYLFIMLNL